MEHLRPLLYSLVPTAAENGSQKVFRQTKYFFPKVLFTLHQSVPAIWSERSNPVKIKIVHPETGKEYEKVENCPRCKTGQLLPDEAFEHYMFNPSLFGGKRLPVWKCVQCGHQEDRK